MSDNLRTILLTALIGAVIGVLALASNHSVPDESGTPDPLQWHEIDPCMYDCPPLRPTSRKA